ncbi:hypothetical protein [Bifidobacterium crudilactis]|uniref:hypothetical protein n=1 Tax=Bifidobacterium crudilactis TaxID=327277 RepID=UPI00264734AD|nr:hypothetical protein [Bifidobacterium crudilactis]MDN6209716.1 hypothetical protein [Bifidobacterium crudilactis]
MQVTQTITDHVIHWTAQPEAQTGVRILALQNPAPQAPPGSEKFMTLIGLGKWIALIICVFAIILGAALWAIHPRRGADSDGSNKVGSALIGVIIISFAASVVGWLGGF